MLRDWNSLPECMKKEEVKKYYMDLAKKRPALFAKRFLDVVLGIILTVLLSPVMLILAVCIKLDSKGPIFYRQERITQYGRPYRIFKFRTMVADADKQGPLVTRGGDSRITNIGRKLRKCRLDEIPQLFNVLKGDMSFVGPRPERKYFADQIKAINPDYELLYQVRPGLFSPATLYNGYTDTMEKMLIRLRMDLDYLRTRTFWLDCKIILLTIASILLGKKF